MTRVRGFVLANTMRIVKLLGRLLEGFSPNP
jgi:hypothetical protein